jgi:nucleoside-diphosphate-sugar epimerase
MHKRVLITGGTGFLGVHLARYFLKKNYLVTLLDLAPLTAADIKDKVKVIKADIRDKKELDQHFQDIDYVVHAAAALPISRSKRVIFSTNVEGTKNVMQSSLSGKVKRVVFISTTAVYGVPKHLPEEEDDTLDPIGYYGESKVMAEKICKRYAKKGLSINIIRPKTFLGPERLGVFTLWFEAIHTNRPVIILGKGNNLYQLLAVEDLCELIFLCLTKKVTGETFNAGAEVFGTWRQDLGALVKFADSQSRIASLPTRPSQFLLAILETLHLSPIMAWHYKTMPIDSYVSSKKAQKKLGFIPSISNEAILIESYKWYRDNRDSIIHTKGTTHRTVWNFRILDILARFL